MYSTGFSSGGAGWWIHLSVAVKGGDAVCNIGAAVSGQAIPDQQNGAADLGLQMLHKSRTFALPMVFFIQPEVELSRCDFPRPSRLSQLNWRCRIGVTLVWTEFEHGVGRRLIPPSFIKTVIRPSSWALL